MATSYLGKGAFIGLGEESTWGTAVARSKWFRCLPGPSVTRDITKTPRNSMHVSGSVPVSLSHYIADDNVIGGFSVLMGYQSMGIWLKHIMGTAGTPALQSGSDYETIYTLGADLPEGLTMELGRGNGTSETFEGCLINRATMSVEAGGQAVLNVSEVIGETSAARTTLGTPSYSTTDRIMDHHHWGTLGWNAGNLTIRSFSLDINNALGRRQQLGFKTTKRPTRSGPIELTANVSMEVDDTVYADFLSDVEDASGTITATYDGVTWFEIDLKNFYLDNVTDAVSGPGMLLANLTFKMQGDGTDHGLQITMANQQSNALGVSGRF